MPPRIHILDRSTRIILTALVLLLALVAVELWGERGGVLPAAMAQIPDSGLQRNQLLEEARRTNALLEQILRHLESKPIRVRLQTDERGGKSASSPSAR